MKKRLLVIFVAVAMVVCSMSTLSFATETKTAKFTFSADTTIVNNTLELTDGDVTLNMKDGAIAWFGGESGLYVSGDNNQSQISVPKGKKITGVYFYLGSSGAPSGNTGYFGLQNYYEKDGTGTLIPGSQIVNQFITKANGDVITLNLDTTNNVEYYMPSETNKVETFTFECAQTRKCIYLTQIVVTYEDINMIGDEELTKGQTYSKAGAGSYKDLSYITNNGTLKYDVIDGIPTIYLNGVTLDFTGTELRAIFAEASELNIVLEGTNIIKASDENNAIETTKNLNISGSGSLFIKNAGSCGIKSDGDITIDGAQLDITSVYHSIDAQNISFTGASKVNAICSDYQCKCIDASETITFDLEEGGIVSAKSTGTDGIAVNVESPDTINILGNSKITTPKDGYVYEAVDEYGDPTGEYIAAKDSVEPAAEVVVEYVSNETKKAGADTGDANNIMLFSIMGIIALCGVGFVYKKREN